VALPLVGVESVEKTFGRVRAVEAFSMEVGAGELVALVGPNGAGKTTMLRMIIGMLRPDSGRIVYGLGGVPSESVDSGRIGYLPEERGLYTDVPVRRVLIYFAALRGMGRPEAARETSHWLDRLGLGDRAGEPVGSLSKGNQQKVQFLSAILHRPALAVLDEPFSGLDPLNQEFFLDLIRELRASGTTVLFSAHQMQLVERLADRVIVIREGKCLGQGTVEDWRRRWRTGRRLRLRLRETPDLAPLRSTPGVRDVQETPEGDLEVALEEDGSLGDLLRDVSRYHVLELRTEEVTLHEIYLRAVGGGAESREVVA
jgi:ABC-2 type transport system ATP-binding protein